jgi:prevent-host-death family protein
LKKNPPERNLVSMTRIAKVTASADPRGRKKDTRAGRWLLQDAKARFSELVRRVKTDGPQLVTVHGREEVVVISAEEFRRLRGEQSGKALIAAMQASPHRGVSLEPAGVRAPVRDVAL